jgi:tricorn protease
VNVANWGGLMDATGYYRYPTIHEATVVFVSEDDLWAVDAGGGIARRLTASSGDIAYPRLSPDGRWIAFTGREEGHPEVYVVPAEGGTPRRVTFLGGEACIVSGWTPNGSEILFSSDAYSPFVKETHAFAVPLDGGIARPLDYGHVMTIDVAANGAVLLARNANDTARWKRYRGGTAGDVWIDARASGTFTRLIDLPGPVNPFWLAGRAYFVSDHEGIANLYSCLPDGADLRRHTNEREYYVRFPSSDGTRIVYQAGAEIALYDPRSDASARIAISTPSPAPQTVRRFVEAGAELEHFSPSPDGTQLALIARGQPYTMPLWEEAVTHYGAGSRVRYRLAEWMHDGKRLACVDDATGYERVALIATVGAQEKHYVTDDDFGRFTDLALSPKSDVIAFANHRHELYLHDVKSRASRKIDVGRAMRIGDLTFSPDGKFIAYTWSPTHDVSIIRIADVASGETHDVSSPMRVDRSPAWDPDGNYLYFISTRDFNPVYDALQFDLSFPQAMRPFLVTLRKDVASPFVPKPAPIHRDGKDDEKEKDEETPALRIDFDGIAGRVIGFPVEEADYEHIVAAKGRALFTKFPVKGIKPEGRSWDEEPEAGVLQAYDFEQQRAATLASNVSEMRLGADHRTLVYVSRDRMRVIDAGRELPDQEDDDDKEAPETTRRTGWLDLSRASVEVAPADEWAQMYYESWRLQREQFWDAAMSDVDWDRVRERYALLLPKLRTRTELSDLIWEAYGELGTSHAYEIGGDHRSPPQYRRGFLGADLAWDEPAGGYRIVRILRGDSWDRTQDSPLAEPGVDVREGDVIVDVGGKPLDADTPPGARLINLAGRETSLGIVRGGERRRILIKTLRSERMLRYRAWVEQNRLDVHRRTEGKVGYLHIPDMGPWGFSEFHRGYLSELDREGLLVDVRFNRGGHVSPLLLEKLARKRVGYDVPRYGPLVPYPPESVAGPIVALTNQFAGSDGDIFSHCFKLYKLGPLVGKRTWGGVVGINPYHRLVDGTLTTQPEFSFWFVDVGWAVENYGTDPDYDVDIAPHDAKAGRDPQLDKALELMAAALASREPPPAFHPRPKLTLPT